MSKDSAADFMRDQLEALLASPALARVAERHSEGSDQPAEREDLVDSVAERDTEPSIDVQSLRAALDRKVK